ncbi:MAG: helix-turn-helix domain-containing protein [Acidobacteriota bacterium]
MQFVTNPLALLCVLGIAQALVLALVLLTSRRGNQTANKILAALTVTIAVGVAASVLSSTLYFRIYPHLTRINHPFDFLGGPLLFLYIKALTSKNFKFGKKELLHFLPAALVALFLVPFYLQSASYKLASLSWVTWYQWRSVLVIGQFLVYLVLIVLMIARFSKGARRSPNPSDKMILFQVRFLVVSFVSLWVLAILRYAFDLKYPAHMAKTTLILPLGVTLMIYALAYLSLRKSEVLIGIEDREPEKKYQKSTLTPERAERYLQKLLHAMQVDKVYTDGDLTLQKLASQLAIPAQHLSQVVNEQLNQNILDFINTHRVDEAKRRLIDPANKHLSILAIAEEVGFNSKSSFNAVFKKYAGITPSEFRKAGENGQP